ncbi:hypothetical protein LX32DRAFT_292558 [Colletotrichum zoysiae]|uniref:Uncharacterized protein n=1 Tax=Colletotrichum zoysiae TaxID=1216348 RepID=A0AAD9M6T8_9PEZI|nr:hypothetical protein LX32DRAFT_292558 [Colletotrichum zoysiae]
MRKQSTGVRAPTGFWHPAAGVAHERSSLHGPRPSVSVKANRLRPVMSCQGGGLEVFRRELQVGYSGTWRVRRPRRRRPTSPSETQLQSMSVRGGRGLNQGCTPGTAKPWRATGTERATWSCVLHGRRLMRRCARVGGPGSDAGRRRRCCPVPRNRPCTLIWYRSISA